MWKALIPPVLVVALGLVSQSAAAQDVLDTDALASHGFAIAGILAADAFSTLPSEQEFVGQRFTISRPVEAKSSIELARLAGGWAYDRERQILRVGLPTIGWMRSDYPQAESDDFMHYGLHVASRTLSQEQRPVQNAFGARFEVKAFSNQQISVAPLTRRERGASVEIGREVFVDLPLEPEVARRAVDGMKVISEGVLEPVRGNTITLCVDRFAPATIDLPIESQTRQCVLNGRIERVQLVSGQGEVLAEWLPK